MIVSYWFRRSIGGSIALLGSLYVLAHALQAEARSCTQSEIRRLIAQATAQKLGKIPNAISECGEVAVPYLIPLLSHQNPLLRRQAAARLGNIRIDAKSAIRPLAERLLEDKDIEVRSNSAIALGNIAPRDAETLAALLKAFKQDGAIRADVAYALGKNSAGEEKTLNALIESLVSSKDELLRLSIMDALYDIGKDSESGTKVLLKILQDPDEANTIRANAAKALSKTSSPKEENIAALITALQKDAPSQVRDNASNSLKVMTRSLQEKAKTAQQIDTASKLVSQVIDAMQAPEFERNRAAILSVRENLEDRKRSLLVETTRQWLNEARNIWLAHILFWLALIFAYPKSPQIQAIFFWNPWVRRILGAGYVGFALTWVPFLRRKLLEPFKPSLLADARLSNFDPTTYFPESNVILAGSRSPAPLRTIIPGICGQIILEGRSGSGKSMFLRHLVERSSRIVVFLPARKCETGVIEAIQAKLHGQAQDAEFLKNLIYSGAIDICIDGLNEVSADTRAKISQFVESYFKGNIILTTQPIEWIAPTTAKIYELQPLQTDQIETFLLSRQSIVAPTSATDYIQSCREYLIHSLNPDQFPEELAATQRILSNPMDLTIVAQMIALGKTPDLFRLQEQQYQLMAKDYRDRWNQDFPLKKFSEALYQLRLNDEKAIPHTEFLQELLSMEDEKYKMVVSRQWKDAKNEPQQEWYCRHDKIMEFFIVQTFLGDSETAQNRLLDHMGDSRFRGVYFLLATLLPLEKAADLREELILYAANNKDHTVSDTFVQLFHTRAKLTAETTILA